MIKPAELETLSQQVGDHLFNHYLPFWYGPALDQECGGWQAWLTNDLQPDRSQPKGLILNSRILWAFSAAHQARPDPVYFEMAERAFGCLMHKFWDAEQGGAFWRISEVGQIVDDSKKIYGQAFYLYALAEFYQASRHPAALERAKVLFELIERHAYDPQFGGYVEVCLRNWSAAVADSRLSDKDMNEKKSMNNHLHLLEAYTNLHRVWPEPRVAARLRELIDIFLTHILDPRTHHLHHFFNEQWGLRSNTYTFGHDIEFSWLLCEAAAELRDAPLLAKVRTHALSTAQVVLTEGLSPSTGLCYEGRAGKIIDAGRECWPQAEALVGFLNAFELSGNEAYFAAARQTWKFINEHLVDRVHGEWFWRIQPNGQPDSKLPKVSEWKGPYHATRACLETMRRTRRLLADKSMQIA